MAFMITGGHLDMRLLIPVDIENEQGMAVGFHESSSNGKERKPGTLQLREGSKRHQRSQQQTEGKDSVETEAEYDADEQGSDHQDHETTRITPVPSGPPGDRRSQERNRASDQPRLLTRTIKSRKATRRNFECETLAEEQQWESLRGVIPYSRTTRQSKAVSE